MRCVSNWQYECKRALAIHLCMLVQIGCGGTQIGGDADEDEQPPGPDLCGNGSIDEHEQCDDGNRMNGDGCNWHCMNGDGDPPDTSPSTDALPLDPSGPPTVAVIDEEVIPNQDSFDLEWNGEQYSLMYVHQDPAGETLEASFRRFDPQGVELLNEWDLEISDPETPVTVDHVWTGSEYGLFWGNRPAGGIWYARLGETGKTLAPPELIVDDPEARHHCVAWAGSEYGMAWLKMPEYEPADLAYRTEFGTFDQEGAQLLSSSVTVHEKSMFVPRIAWGDGGSFRLTQTVLVEPDSPTGSVRGVRSFTIRTNGSIVEETNIGDGFAGDVEVRTDGYGISFAHSHADGSSFEAAGIYFAGLIGLGHLLEAPYRVVEGIPDPTMGTKLAADPAGYGLLWSSKEDSGTERVALLLGRIDSRGRLAEDPILVSSGAGSMFGVRQYDIAWGGSGFLVAYSVGETVIFQIYE